MSKFLRHVLLASLFLTIFLPGPARAQQDGNGGAPPADGGAPGGHGRGGRGNWQGGPAPDGSAPNGGVNRHGAPGGSASATPAKVAPKAATSGEQFYMISSVDPAKQEVLLKRPTEVTLLMKIGDSTQITDETGKPLRVIDLRAGDTVWVTSSAGGAEPTAVHIRKGQMTVADLHRFYLDYGPIK